MERILQFSQIFYMTYPEKKVAQCFLGESMVPWQ